MVVWQLLEGVGGSGAYPHDPGVRIDRFHLGTAKMGAWHGGAHGSADVPGRQRARRDLRQHRGEEQVIALANERHLRALLMSK